MKTQIGITDENRLAVANELSMILADEYVLYTITKNAHWNAEGEGFIAEHRFFESQYKQLDHFIENIAERIRSLGHYAPATMKSFLMLTHLTEKTREKNDSKGFINELLASHESIIIRLRERIHQIEIEFHDSGTSDFITRLMESHEKMAWLLRSHL